MLQMVAVSDILAHITESVEHLQGDWIALCQRKCGDTTFGMLLDVVDTEGCFRDPICIDVSYSTLDWYLGNGHHRMAVAILCCLEEIPVWFSDGEGFMCADVTDPNEDEAYTDNPKWSDWRQDAFDIHDWLSNWQ